MRSFVYFLSHKLNSKTPTYGNRDLLKIEPNSSISMGGSSNSSSLFFSTNHFGSHVDVPYHFFEDGSTVDVYPANYWISDSIQIIDVPCEEARLISVTDIASVLTKNIEVLLIRTGYEKYRNQEKYWNDNPGLSSELGIYLKENCPNLRFVGFDFISLTSFKHREEGKKAHLTFLGSDNLHSEICILEDISLVNIESSLDKIIISPLVIEKSCSALVTIFGFKHE